MSAGCGDDSGGNPDARVDAVSIDSANPADAGDPDAMPPAGLMRSNTIAVTELSITGPVAAGVGGVQGAAVPVTFRDLTTITNPPTVVGASPVNGCQVTVWDLAGGDTPPDNADEGVVTVMGTSYGAFQCAFNATAGTHVCGNTAPGALGTASTAITADGNGTMVYKIVGADFTGVSVRGRWLNVSGFPDAAANGLFPIVGPGMNPDEVVVNNPKCGATPGLCSTTVAAGPGYALVIGAGPIPIFNGTVPVPVQFLDNGNDEGDAGPVGADVVISKAASTAVPAFTVTVKANGEGLTLDDASVQPHALGTTGIQTFSCGGVNGECGNSDGGTVINGLIIFGETSDGSLTTGCNGGPCGPFDMPDPVDTFATFQCSAVGLLGNPTPTSVSITAEAMTAIMGTTPTRIQTTIANAAGEIAVSADQTSSTFVVVGHGLLGFTTPTP